MGFLKRLTNKIGSTVVEKMCMMVVAIGLGTFGTALIWSKVSPASADENSSSNVIASDTFKNYGWSEGVETITDDKGRTYTYEMRSDGTLILNYYDNENHLKGQGVYDLNAPSESGIGYEYTYTYFKDDGSVSSVNEGTQGGYIDNGRFVFVWSDASSKNVTPSVPTCLNTPQGCA